MSWLVLLALAAADVPDGGPSEVEVLRARTTALEDRLAELEGRLHDTEVHTDAVEQRAEEHQRLKVDVGGYLDLGFFAVQGNGSGVRRDLGRTQPEYGDILSSWVLVGDPLSTTINSRGDSADLGDSRALTHDPLQSKGRPTFLVNALNLRLAAELDDTWLATVLVDFLPRERAFAGGAFGDLFEVKLASVRWQHDFGWGGVSVVVGKFDSLLGIEYRQQEAPLRLTVTPSLLCRYTCGRPVGLKARVELLDQRLEFALSVTNGSAMIEQFPFSNETDFNVFKTLSGRVALRMPWEQGFELSISGAVGAQDRQVDDSLMQWHLGAAARFETGPFQAQAEFVIGRAPGKDAGGVACAGAACLQYKGAYGLLGYRVAMYFVPYLRVDWREATMRSGREWAYVSKVLRGTLGVRFEPRSRIAVKAEYTLNRELTKFEFPDDVFTASFIVSW